MSANRGRVWLVAIAIFIFGTAVGSSLTAWFGIQRIKQNIRNPSVATGFGERAANRMGDDLVSALQLTPEEEAQIRTQLGQMSTQLRQLRRRANLDAAAELRNTMSRIAASLPPEKRGKLREVVRRRYEKLGLTPPELIEK